MIDKIVTTIFNDTKEQKAELKKVLDVLGIEPIFVPLRVKITTELVYGGD